MGICLKGHVTRNSNHEKKDLTIVFELSKLFIFIKTRHVNVNFGPTLQGYMLTDGRVYIGLAVAFRQGLAAFQRLA